MMVFEVSFYDFGEDFVWYWCCCFCCLMVLVFVEVKVWSLGLDEECEGWDGVGIGMLSYVMCVGMLRLGMVLIKVL